MLNVKLCVIVNQLWQEAAVSARQNYILLFGIELCIMISFFNLLKASLTYAEAQMRIDSAAMNDDITISLRGLNKLAKILKKRRIDNG